MLSLLTECLTSLYVNPSPKSSIEIPPSDNTLSTFSFVVPPTFKPNPSQFPLNFFSFDSFTSLEKVSVENFTTFTSFNTAGFVCE